MQVPTVMMRVDDQPIEKHRTPEETTARLLAREEPVKSAPRLSLAQVLRGSTSMPCSARAWNRNRPHRGLLSAVCKCDAIVWSTIMVRTFILQDSQGGPYHGINRFSPFLKAIDLAFRFKIGKLKLFWRGC